MPDRTDVIVVGGGMVGALTALALARCELNITVVEQTKPAEYSTDRHDLRVSAISQATLQMLKTLDAWDAIRAARSCPYSRMLVWDKASAARTCFDSANVGHEQLGFIIENSLIQTSLWDQLAALDHVSLKCPATVVDLELHDDAAVLRLDSGEVLTADLIIAADGSRSTTRELAGIRVTGETYNQHALVATVATELPQQDITWQRFTETGPQAFLPLAGHRASMVWYHDESRIAELKAMADTEFLHTMEAEFPQQLGGLTAIENRGSFPLLWSHADQYVKPRFALVGDAAHAVHPLAGQGVNLGMLDAATLVQCILEGMAEGRHPGHVRHLRRYERWRKPANELMIRLLDGIQQVFQPDDRSAIAAGAMKAFRTAALNMADSVGPINKLCMRSAMGLSGDLPDLAHGRLPLTIARADA